MVISFHIALVVCFGLCIQYLYVELSIVYELWIRHMFNRISEEKSNRQWIQIFIVKCENTKKKNLFNTPFILLSRSADFFSLFFLSSIYYNFQTKRLKCIFDFMHVMLLFSCFWIRNTVSVSNRKNKIEIKLL